eukprot:2234314-Rhodomonas_salina.1
MTIGTGDATVPFPTGETLTLACQRPRPDARDQHPRDTDTDTDTEASDVSSSTPHPPLNCSAGPKIEGVGGGGVEFYPRSVGPACEVNISPRLPSSSPPSSSSRAVELLRDVKGRPCHPHALPSPSPSLPPSLPRSLIPPSPLSHRVAA